MVVPCLLSTDIYRLDFVRILQVIAAVRARGISTYFVLTYCISDCLCSASCLIFRLILELILPAILCSDCLRCNFRSIRKQSYCDAVRSHLIPVVMVVPRLLATDVYRLT